MAAQALEVVFHGATLLVVEHSNQPYVPMKPVVSGMALVSKDRAEYERHIAEKVLHQKVLDL